MCMNTGDWIVDHKILSLKHRCCLVTLLGWLCVRNPGSASVFPFRSLSGLATPMHQFLWAHLVFIMFPFIVKRNKTNKQEPPLVSAIHSLPLWNFSTMGYASGDEPWGRKPWPAVMEVLAALLSGPSDHSTCSRCPPPSLSPTRFSGWTSISGSISSVSPCEVQGFPQV